MSGHHSERRVVVTGCGVLSALGDSAAALHAALCEGRIGTRPITGFALDELFPGDADGSRIDRTAAEIEIDPGYFGGGNLRPIDRAGQIAIAAAHLALADGGWTAEMRAAREVGLVHGTMFGSLRTVVHFDRRALEAGPRYVKPFEFANTVINAAAGQTAIWHDLRGVNSTVAGGAVAGLEAVAGAADLLRARHGDALLAGGADELCVESFHGFHRAGLLCPGEAPRPIPFAAGRNGLRLGEGGALLMLEDLDAARARGATLRAEILGHGSAFDPSGGRDAGRAAKSAARAMRLALVDAGLDAADIDALSLSANGDPRGDRREALAVAKVFGERARELPLTAVKAALGETLGSAGALQCVVALEALRTGEVPGIAGFDRLDPELPPLAVSAETRSGAIRHVLVHAAGLDGKSCALVLATLD